MRGINIAIILIAILIITAFSLTDWLSGGAERRTTDADQYLQDTEIDTQQLTTFESHPVRWEVATSVPTTLHLETIPAESRAIVADQIVARGVNFAGSFSIALRSCGAGCQLSTIVDMKSGTVVEDAIISANGISFSKDSQLLIVNPFEDQPETATSTDTYFYRIDEIGNLEHLAKYNQQHGFLTGCGAVVIPAQNPHSEEIREFPSPCEVPYGWITDF